MSTPLYHHLLVVLDWEIKANQLFLTEAEVEPALRELAANADDLLPLNEHESKEVLAAKDLDDLRAELEDRDISIYIHTIEAPTPAFWRTPLQEDQPAAPQR